MISNQHKHKSQSNYNKMLSVYEISLKDGFCLLPHYESPVRFREAVNWIQWTRNTNCLLKLNYDEKLNYEDRHGAEEQRRSVCL